ncbi:MAG: MBL fold metallo-hydrolase [Bacteroidia bacterium]
MLQVKTFCFSPFQENTYVIQEESKACVIIDPGCYDEAERKKLSDYIQAQELHPEHLLNTHGHVDHVFGNKYVCDTYNLRPEIHQKDLVVLDSLLQVARLYNLRAEASPQPGVFLSEGDRISLGNSVFDIVFTPGHSPGSICFICHAQQFVIGGDVLFRESIGRTDLPGGDHATLLQSIREKLFVLPDAYTVYPGHGSPTTIGYEKKHNPFLK